MDQFLDQKDEEPQEVRPLGSELYEWLQMLMGCVLAAVLLFTCLGRLTRVDGGSMNNTLQHGEMMLVWSLGYQPQQGDIVVVNKTTAEFLGGKAIVKRVIATGGQTVDIDYGTSTVYVDGVALDEPYIREPMGVPYTPSAYDSTGVQTHWEVPEGSWRHRRGLCAGQGGVRPVAPFQDRSPVTEYRLQPVRARRGRAIFYGKPPAAQGFVAITGGLV